jgi:hypothetical protein
MLRNNPPTADAALLAFLATAVVLIIVFAAGVYSLTRPMVLPNAGVAGYELEKKRPDLLAKITSIDHEQAAIRFAEEENARVGITGTVARAQHERPPPAVEPPKTKRVARAPKRAPSEPRTRVAAPAGQFDIFGAFFR